LAPLVAAPAYWLLPAATIAAAAIAATTASAALSAATRAAGSIAIGCRRGDYCANGYGDHLFADDDHWLRCDGSVARLHHEQVAAARNVLE
jgi:hypothetical protein